jgi:hypothetical protein
LFARALWTVREWKAIASLRGEQTLRDLPWTAANGPLVDRPSPVPGVKAAPDG